jgi:hypothetical protein
MKTLPDSLRAPITDKASAMAWVRALAATDFAWHFDDSTDDVFDDVLSEDDQQLLSARRDALYTFGWGPDGDANSLQGYWYCPIGFLASCEPFNAHNQAEGFEAGAVEFLTGDGLVLLDFEHVESYAYGDPGRFRVFTEAGQHLGSYDMPEDAEAAHPCLGDRLTKLRDESRAAWARRTGRA